MVALVNESMVGVATGDNRSLMPTAAGALFSFGHGLFAALATATGYGAYGQLGHGDTTHQLQPKPFEALADERGLGVAADSSHSLALTAEGALFSFGSSANGQLGHVGRSDQQRVAALANMRAWLLTCFIC